jgi:epoxyqueuosine reductase QueG
MNEKIQRIMKDHQIRVYGFANVSEQLPEKYSELPTAISFVVRMSDDIMNPVSAGPTHEYFHLYRTANRFIDDVAFKIVLMLQNEGFRAVPVAASQSINIEGNTPYSGLFSHRLAATRAGLGWIGKNNSLITFEYGPRVRLGTILTDWVATYAAPIEKSYCGECNICVEHCPALALSGLQWQAGVDRERIVDVRACSNFMKKNYEKIGRGAVCGICVSVCPVGQERK